MTFDLDLETRSSEVSNSLPCEFGTNPLSGSRDISYTKKNTDWRRHKQNLPQFTECGKNRAILSMLGNLGTVPSWDKRLAVYAIRRYIKVFLVGIGTQCPSNTDVTLDDRVRGPCSRASVHTTRSHGPYSRPVNTSSVVDWQCSLVYTDIF